jgi:hypothetical protein
VIPCIDEHIACNRLHCHRKTHPAPFGPSLSRTWQLTYAGLHPYLMLLKLACQILKYIAFDTGGFHGPRLRQHIMPHSNEFFSFSKRHHDDTSLPTFDLPGVVCGAIRVDRKWAQSVQVVKTTLKGELKQSLHRGTPWRLTCSQGSCRPASPLACPRPVSHKCDVLSKRYIDR